MHRRDAGGVRARLAARDRRLAVTSRLFVMLPLSALALIPHPKTIPENQHESRLRNMGSVG